MQHVQNIFTFLKTSPFNMVQKYKIKHFRKKYNTLKMQTAKVTGQSRTVVPSLLSHSVYKQ